MSSEDGNTADTNDKKKVTQKQWALISLLVICLIAALFIWKTWKPAETPLPPVEKSVVIEVAGNIPEVFAGRAEQKAANIVLKEGTAGSLTADQTVVLTLPANARWESFGATMPVNSVSLELIGIDGRSASFKVVGASTSAAELTVRNAQIKLEPGKLGPIVAQVSGSSGLSGDLTIAQAVSPISVSAAGKTRLVIGKRDQSLPELTISESKPGCIMFNRSIKISLPQGVFWGGTPKAEVTSGDLKLNSVYSSDERNLFIQIRGDSTTASSIKLSGINIYLDRMVPEGDVELNVAGDALNETGGTPESSWPNSTTVATFVAAEVVTPSPGGVITSTFTVGSTKYTINGVEQTMDSPPYLADGVVLMPVRYAVAALGISESSIIWDDTAKTVTVSKGNKIVQMQLGSTTMLANSVSISVDAAPEIKDGHTMVPLRSLVNVFGATFALDSATNTITVSSQ